jgi:hypothetical protein
MRFGVPEQLRMHDYLNKVSTVFNVADSIPLVALWAAPIRGEIFKVFTVASATVAGVGLVGQLLLPNEKHWEDLTRQGTDLAIHGSMEVARATAEFILGITFFGSIGLLLAQWSTKNGFAPIFDYKTSPTALFFPQKPTSPSS